MLEEMEGQEHQHHIMMHPVQMDRQRTSDDVDIFGDVAGDVNNNYDMEGCVDMWMMLMSTLVHMVMVQLYRA